VNTDTITTGDSETALLHAAQNLKGSSAINGRNTCRRSPALRLWLTFWAIGLVATGCGGGGGDDDSAGGGGGGGTSWSVSGTPPTQIMAGSQFSFSPTINNPNGVTLTFGITNPPSWATFSTTTGAVTGTPGAGDVGTYTNINVSVSDGQTTVTRGPYSIQVVATATGSATLTWTPPTQNTDGTSLTNLTGYKIYWGTSQSNLTNSATLTNPGLATFVVDQLTPATWYFAATATNSAGAESAFSNIGSKTIN